MLESQPGEYVPWNAARWKHDAVYLRAQMFKREFGYDFVQWDPTARDVTAHAYLFNDDTGLFGHGAIAGACALMWRDGERPGWAMQWIWLAPALRRKGILSRRWEQLRKRFGEFYLERPLSPAMAQFAESRGQIS